MAYSDRNQIKPFENTENGRIFPVAKNDFCYKSIHWNG